MKMDSDTSNQSIKDFGTLDLSEQDVSEKYDTCDPEEFDELE